MNRKRIVLLIYLIVSSMCSFANTLPDSTISITYDELRIANQIFVDHERLSIENELLIEQVDAMQYRIDNLLELDSLRINELNYYQTQHNLQLQEMQSIIKNKDKHLLYWKIGGITVTAGLLLFLLLK